MTKLFTLFLAMLLSVACYGQEKVTIKSRVVDSKTRNDVPGVTVQLLSSDSTVIEPWWRTTIGPGMIRKVIPPSFSLTCQE